jgi:hypothetical protein
VRDVLQNSKTDKTLYECWKNHIHKRKDEISAMEIFNCDLIEAVELSLCVEYFSEKTFPYSSRDSRPP